MWKNTKEFLLLLKLKLCQLMFQCFTLMFYDQSSVSDVFVYVFFDVFIFENEGKIENIEHWTPTPLNSFKNDMSNAILALTIETFHQIIVSLNVHLKSQGNGTKNSSDRFMECYSDSSSILMTLIFHIRHRCIICFRDLLRNKQRELNEPRVVWRVS